MNTRVDRWGKARGAFSSVPPTTSLPPFLPPSSIHQRTTSLPSSLPSCVLNPTETKTRKPKRSGDLFAVAPIPPGTRAQVVEPVSDSSRNFVLRLADAATGRHAFVGLGFAERPDAFDFNVALGDHDKHVRRGREIEEAKAAAAAAAPSSSSASTSSRQQQPDEADSVRSAVSALYGAAGRDLSLKEGETIKVAVVKSGGGTAATAGDAAAAGGGGFLARQQTAAAAGGFSLPPPPGTALAPPPAPAASSGAPAPAAPPAEDQGWATFD